MRMTQISGLSVQANAYLEVNAVHDHFELRKNGEVVNKYDLPKSMESGNTYNGMFDEEEYPLMEYEMKDGSSVYEFVQATPWSSGPVIFLALEDVDDNPIDGTLWDEKEINNA